MANYKILIIENNRTYINELSHHLRSIVKTEYTVTGTTQIDQFIDLISSEQYDCILAEYYLTIKSEINLLPEIENHAKNTPILILSNQSYCAKNKKIKHINKTTSTFNEIENAISEVITQQQKNTDSRILIIDDSIIDIEWCHRLLQKAENNYTIESSTSSTDCFNIISEFNPDCILLDYSMPGYSGIDAVKRITQKHPFIPIIIITGQGNEKIAVEAIKNGAENYLIKTYLDSIELNQTIQKSIQKKKLEQSLATAEEKLRVKDQQLDDAGELYNLIIDSIPAGVFIKDDNLNIIKSNHVFNHSFCSTNIPGKPYHEGCDINQLKTLDRKTFDEGKNKSLDYVTQPDGSHKIFQTRRVRFFDSNGKSFILGISSDITEREEIISQLEKANRELEDFTYIASHDLKSPLSAIEKLTTWIEQDYEDSLPDGAKKSFSMIKSRSKRLSYLLDDLLDHSLVSNQLTVESELEFDNIVNQAYTSVNGSENFNLSVPSVIVKLPSAALKIITKHLISNTVKHHGKQSGSISLSIKRTSNGYYIYYTDDGQGIPEVHADKVFKIFHTLKSRDEIEGSGIGLTTVKKIINYYNGNINLIYKNGQQGVNYEIFWPSNDNFIHQNKSV